MNSTVIVTANSEIEADAYGIDGSKIAAASGNGIVSLDLSGRHGVIVIVARTTDGIKTMKLSI